MYIYLLYIYIYIYICTRSFFFTRPRGNHVSGAPGRRSRDRHAIQRKSASECPGRFQI